MRKERSCQRKERPYQTDKEGTTPTLLDEEGATLLDGEATIRRDQIQKKKERYSGANKEGAIYCVGVEGRHDPSS